MLYRSVIKKVLFKIHPDTVHEHLLKSGKLAGQLQPVRGTLGALWSYQNEAYLAQMLAGVRFRNPIGLSAGFDTNFELPPLLRAVGFGHMEGGSVTYEPCPGNAHPWFYRLPHSKSLVVHKGLANEGTERVAERIGRYPSKMFADFPCNISVAMTNAAHVCDEQKAIDDYAGSVEVLKATGVGDIITLNISCPNTCNGEPFTTKSSLARLLDAIDAIGARQPLFLKMPADLSWKQFKPLLETAADHSIAGVIISNLVKDRSLVHPDDKLTPEIKGNLSGKPTWTTSNELIKKTRQTFGDRFVIIGVGGVFSAEDAYTKICLGADLVSLITGMIFEGPQLIGQINRDLVKLLEQDGFTNISQAIGSNLRKMNPK
ncbi:quinone-dependent dihydroorotate dehydrogenase [Candidatus Saccharibacteria bacterium]|nr:quinone-dependent dihydroorotate dehydrogenase [Candidatus Saccharibacteria bacterium]